MSASPRDGVRAWQAGRGEPMNLVAKHRGGMEPVR